MSAFLVSEMESPVGTLLLGMYNGELCCVEFGRLDQLSDSLKKWARRWTGADRLIVDGKALQPFRSQLEQYFAGNRKTFDLPVRLYGTPFQLRVWSALSSIPYGETRSYKEVAKKIGCDKAVRAVGGANHRNPLSIIVPCHRVIGSDGSMVGYGGGLSVKIRLLELEAKYKER